MTYIVETNKTIDEITNDLEISVKKHGFGVLHIHNLKATLIKKGFDFKKECKIFEVCKPEKANEVLNYDITLNMALPCRISIWEENNQLKIGMISPQDTLALLSDSKKLLETAIEVEENLKTIINEAK